jgi:putative ATPase
MRINACAEAFDRVGMPEGRYHLAQATLYLATTAKSNSVMGFFDALATVEKEREGDIPNHLKDANRDKQTLGHGAGYLYPHAYRDHWVAQQYLPASLQGQMFYQPSEQGFEAKIRTQVARRRETQLAAIADSSDSVIPESVTFSPTDKTQARWLQRTLSQAGERLAQVRDRLFALAQPQRHHLVLVVNDGSGLLVWEALRCAPEGGVYVLVSTAAEVQRLQEQAANLPDLLRPIILQSSLENFSTVIDPALRFDRILGRNVLTHLPDKAIALQTLNSWLQPQGVITLAESIPRQAQRLYQLISRQSLDPALYQRWMSAEEAIYTQTQDWRMNWDQIDLQRAGEQMGLQAEIETEQQTADLYISAALIDRWFAIATTPPSYADYLAQALTATEIAEIHTQLRRQVQNQSVPWKTAIAFLKASDRTTTVSRQIA